MREVIIPGMYPKGAQYAEHGVGECMLYVRQYPGGHFFEFEVQLESGKKDLMFKQELWPHDHQLTNWIGVARQIHFRGRI